MKLLLAFLLLILIGCKEENNPYQITQIWQYNRPDSYKMIWYDEKPEWKLSTYVYKNGNIIQAWGIMTEQPDSCKQKYIQIAKEYIESDKRRYDTIIYIK